MAFLERGEASIYYETAGSGPALLLSHGYALTSALWQPQLASLTDRAKVISWDIRGHGQTLCPESEEHFSHELSVEDMLALLDANEVEKAVLGGHSLGGYLSLMFAMKYPQRVQALMLVCTGPGYRNEEARAKWNKFANRQAEKLEAGGLSALTIPGGIDSTGMQHGSAKALALAARNILAQKDDSVMNFVPNIAWPTLVLIGSEDEQYFGATDYMVKKIPTAEKVVIENAGHAANLDQPQAFNSAVVEFLESL